MSKFKSPDSFKDLVRHLGENDEKPNILQGQKGIIVGPNEIKEVFRGEFDNKEKIEPEETPEEKETRLGKVRREQKFLRTQRDILERLDTEPKDQLLGKIPINFGPIDNPETQRGVRIGLMGVLRSLGVDPESGDERIKGIRLEEGDSNSFKDGIFIIGAELHELDWKNFFSSVLFPVPKPPHRSGEIISTFKEIAAQYPGIHFRIQETEIEDLNSIIRNLSDAIKEVGAENLKGLTIKIETDARGNGYFDSTMNQFFINPNASIEEIKTVLERKEIMPDKQELSGSSSVITTSETQIAEVGGMMPETAVTETERSVTHDTPTVQVVEEAKKPELPQKPEVIIAAPEVATPTIESKLNQSPFERLRERFPEIGFNWGPELNDKNQQTRVAGHLEEALSKLHIDDRLKIHEIRVADMPTAAHYEGGHFDINPNLSPEDIKHEIEVALSTKDLIAERTSGQEIELTTDELSEILHPKVLPITQPSPEIIDTKVKDGTKKSEQSELKKEDELSKEEIDKLRQSIKSKYSSSDTKVEISEVLHNIETIHRFEEALDSIKDDIFGTHIFLYERASYFSKSDGIMWLSSRMAKDEMVEFIKAHAEESRRIRTGEKMTERAIPTQPEKIERKNDEEMISGIPLDLHFVEGSDVGGEIRKNIELVLKNVGVSEQKGNGGIQKIQLHTKQNSYENGVLTLDITESNAEWEEFIREIVLGQKPEPVLPPISVETNESAQVLHPEVLPPESDNKQTPPVKKSPEIINIKVNGKTEESKETVGEKVVGVLKKGIGKTKVAAEGLREKVREAREKKKAKKEEKEKAKKEKEPKTPEEQIFASFKKHFGVEKEELEKLPEFTKLSLGQKALLLQNLEQITVRRIKEQGVKRARKGKEDAKVFTYDRKVSRITRNIFSRFYTADAEKTSAQEMEKGGIVMHEAAVKALANQLEAANLAVEVKDDNSKKLEIKYVDKDLIDGATSEQKEAADKFQTAAEAFARIRPEWEWGNKKGKEANKKVKEEYLAAKHNLMTLFTSLKGKQVPIQRFSAIEHRIMLDQLMHANPGIDEELEKINSQSVWTRALQSVALERGGYMTLGYGLRTVSAALLSSLGAATVVPAVVMGGFIARKRAIQDVKEEVLSATSGGKTDITKTIDGVLNTGKGAAFAAEAGSPRPMTPTAQGKEITLLNVVKAENLVDKLVPSNDKTKERRKRAKEMTPERMQARILYTLTKLESGLVDFGSTPEERIKNYDLLASAIAQCSTETELLGRAKEKTMERLDRFLGFKEKGVRKHVNKKMVWGGVLGAVSVGVGYEIHKLIDNWYAGQIRPPDAAVITKTLGVGKTTTAHELHTMSGKDLGIHEAAKEVSGKQELELVNSLFPRQVADKFQLSPSGKIIQEGSSGTYHLNGVTLIHETQGTAGGPITREVFNPATGDSYKLDNLANKAVEAAHALDTAPRAVISKGGNVWHAAEELMKRGKEHGGISKEEFNAAWANSKVLVHGKEIPISKVGLTHQGDQVLYIKATDGKPAHFEIWSHDDESVGSNEDLLHHYEKAKVETPSWLKQSMQSDYVLKPLPQSTVYGSVVEETPLGTFSYLEHPPVLQNLTSWAETEHIKIRPIFEYHLREAGFTENLPAVANHLEDENMHFTEYSLLAQEQRIDKLRPLLEDWRDFAKFNPENEGYRMLVQKVEQSIEEMKEVFIQTKGQFLHSMRGMGLRVPDLKIALDSKIKVEELLVEAKEGKLTKGLQKLAEYIRDEAKPKEKQMKMVLGDYLEDRVFFKKGMLDFKK